MKAILGNGRTAENFIIVSLTRGLHHCSRDTSIEISLDGKDDIQYNCLEADQD